MVWRSLLPPLVPPPLTLRLDSGPCDSLELVSLDGEQMHRLHSHLQIAKIHGRGVAERPLHLILKAQAPPILLSVGSSVPCPQLQI